MRLNKEFTLLKQSNPTQFWACPSDRDTLVWYYVIHNLPPESPYSGGQYFGKLVFPREYPLKPPSIYMITPSGRFEVNTRLCLSMSDYHPESWNPSWRVETILLGLVSFMTDQADPVTAGGIRSTRASREGDALLSFFRNLKNKEFVHHFPEFTDTKKYLIGRGFFFISHDGESRGHGLLRLSETSISEEEVESVQNLNDLQGLLVVHGHRTYNVTTKGNDPQATGKRTADLLAWLAVGVVCATWIFSQYRDSS